MQNTQTTPKISIFPPWNTQHRVPGRSLSNSGRGKEPAFAKILNQSIFVLVDSQEAIIERRSLRDKLLGT